MRKRCLQSIDAMNKGMRLGYLATIFLMLVGKNFVREHGCTSTGSWQDFVYDYPKIILLLVASLVTCLHGCGVVGKNEYVDELLESIESLLYILTVVDGQENFLSDNFFYVLSPTAMTPVMIMGLKRSNEKVTRATSHYYYQAFADEGQPLVRPKQCLHKTVVGIEIVSIFLCLYSALSLLISDLTDTYWDVGHEGAWPGNTSAQIGMLVTSVLLGISALFNESCLTVARFIKGFCSNFYAWSMFSISTVACVTDCMRDQDAFDDCGVYGATIVYILSAVLSARAGYDCMAFPYSDSKNTCKEAEKKSELPRCY